MKAIIVREFGEPEVMKIEELSKPEAGAGQVLVRIEAAGVNPVDTYIRTGTHAQKPDLPYTPGKDAAGTIEAVGEGAAKFKPGDRVYTADSITGTYAEYALCTEDQVHPLPDNVTFEQGAGVFVPMPPPTARLSKRRPPRPARPCSFTALRAGWASHRSSGRKMRD